MIQTTGDHIYVIHVKRKRQCKGSGVMVWMMAMPNGLLSFKVIQGNLNADGYIKLLSDSAVPIIKLNYGVNWYLQEDNSPVHKSRKVKDLIKKIWIFCFGMTRKKPRCEYC